MLEAKKDFGGERRGVSGKNGQKRTKEGKEKLH